MNQVKVESKLQNKTDIIFETDWLASTPVFYNLKSGRASNNINNVIPLGSEASFHPEGLHNFLEYGYSVFGQTSIDNVRFLSPSSRLYRDHNGQLTSEQLQDPFEKYCDYRLSEVDIIELIRERVQKWESSLPADQEIVLPLSGGYDSRLLLWCLHDKSRVRSYTYGLSQIQKNSTEIVHAQRLSEIFSCQWQHIPLGNYHQYFKDWDDLFGISTHAHGMYQLEFYSKIREKLKKENYALLSGIIGDVWAGTVPFHSMKKPIDLVKLAYNHGLHANPEKIKMKHEYQLRNDFWLNNSHKLQDHSYQTVTAMRFKLILLNYLMKLPQIFKFKPWSPFLDIDIAMAMLNLPKKRRANRRWQTDFFAKVGLDLENHDLKSSSTNNLNQQAIIKMPPAPLDVKKLSFLFDRDYIEWINSKFNYKPSFKTSLLKIPKIGGVLRRIGVKDEGVEAYFAYLCLKPLENHLCKLS